jgi:aryl-alcohol dehydrogenase-like predicted oxidoreductase
VDWSVDTATTHLEQTLRTLGRDRLDILFLHEPAPGLLDAEEFHSWLLQQREAGKIRYWGLAGPLELFAPWIAHPLAEVLQIRDVADGSGARQLTVAGREPQITYGALSWAPGVPPAAALIKAALARNPHGSVLVSTRRVSHLRDLAAAVE